MVSTRAIAASHPVGGPARRGMARAEAAADHAGFPAALAAAIRTAGEPVAAAAGDPPPQSGQSIPRQRFELGASSLFVPANPGVCRGGTHSSATGNFSGNGRVAAARIGPDHGEMAPGFRRGEDKRVASLRYPHTLITGKRGDQSVVGEGPPGAKPQVCIIGGTPADASKSAAAASGGSTIGNGQAAVPNGPQEDVAATAAAGADPQKARPPLAEHVAARAGMPVPPQAEAAARKSSPAHAKGAPSRSTERLPHSTLHALHVAGAAAVTPLVVQAIAAIGLSEGTGGSPVADHPGAAASSTADPTGRAAPRRAVSAEEASDPGSPAAPASDQGAADDVAAAGQAPGGDGTAAPPAAPDGAGSAAARLPDGFGTTSRSPAASSSDPTPAIGQKPSPSPGGSLSVPNRSPARPAEPAFFGGPAADAANPSPSAGDGVAAQAKDAPDTPPAGLAEPLPGQMIGAAAGGHHDLALHLHPAELGAVDVRVVVSGRAVSAWFDSPQPQVQQAISQNMGELQRDLATAGYDLNGAWVGGETWTPRERTAGPALPRHSRSTTDSRPTEPVRRAVSAATGSGVSVYV
jgi:hypothetical protein